MTELVLVIVVEVGLVALALVLLNARDRRREQAMAAVLGACPTALRSTIAVHARAPLLRRRVVVTLDMSACDQAHVWSTVRQVAGALPAHAALVVDARLGLTRPAAISVRAWDPTYRARAS